MTLQGELEYAVSQEQIEGWAELTGDHNPLHVSPEFASNTRFGSTIAHGHLSLAFMERLMVQLAGESWLRGGALEGVKFRVPVRPGEPHRIVVAPLADDADDPDAMSIEVRTIAEDTVCVVGRARLPKPVA
jgi:3-hydroxybutyryl-CoA dehydratase